MGKGKKKSKSGKRQEKEAFKVKETLTEVEVPKEDSVAEKLNNALILDDSTEFFVVSNGNIKNNNEKVMITPPQTSKNYQFKSSTDQDSGDSGKKGSDSSRNYSCTSTGDNSWMEKDPFEVSYSGSINYNNLSKKGTK